MTTSNAINVDMINSFFDLSKPLQKIKVTQTATGGLGIDNRHIYPPPEVSVPYFQRMASTDYVEKYRKAYEEESDTEYETPSTGTTMRTARQFLDTSSTIQGSHDDPDDCSTVVLEHPRVYEQDIEATRHVYNTYYGATPWKYDTLLPIAEYREQILEQLIIDDVVIVQGPTGCGKTTQVPQYILDDCQRRGDHCNIAVTQPRRIAATSIAQRVANERGWNLGGIVGCQVGMEAKISTDTRLCYMTTGVLLQKIVNQKKMDMFTHIIIDEVHERNQEIDFALLLVKKFLQNHSQTKIILMSATFDSNQFADYFKRKKAKVAPPILEILGKMPYPVNVYYIHELETLLPGKMVPLYDMDNPVVHESLYEVVYKLMQYFDQIEKDEQNAPKEALYPPRRGAVLIFLPGYEEISRLSQKLQEVSLNKNFWIIPLHSSITADDQAKAFKKAQKDQRKIILSTNIAESSITVPDVKFVIDFCLTKNLVTDPSTNYTSLRMEWASKSNCIQRKGRTGRVEVGKCYRLVPSAFYETLPEYNIPEIKRCPLTSTILQLKKLDICEPQEMLAFALDPPNLEDIGNSILQLKEALALTSPNYNPFDGELTFIGKIMANLPLDVKLSKLIVYGYVFGCMHDCIIIAASLSLQNFFAKPFDRPLAAYKSRRAWAENSFSDCLCYLFAYKTWLHQLNQNSFNCPGSRGQKNWCENYFIQPRRINDVKTLVTEIENRLRDMQITEERVRTPRIDAKEDIQILKIVIAGAFFPNYFLQEPLDEDRINRDLNGNDPLSTVWLSNLPEKQGILYASSLKEKLQPCSNIIDIEFEGSRAYIKFPPETNEMYSSGSRNKIHPGVYLAMKMRLEQKSLMLTLFSKDEAERKCRQIMMSKSSEDNFGNSLYSNRVFVTSNAAVKLRKIEVPLEQMWVKMLITHVVDAGLFYARLENGETKQLNDFIMLVSKQGGHQPLSGPPLKGKLYWAPFIEYVNQRPNYYRSTIQEIFQIDGISKAKVFFVDYGNTELINVSDLREIDKNKPDILTTPLLAFECCLSHLKPNSVYDQWSLESTRFFRSQVNGQILFAKIFSVVNGVYRMQSLMKGTHNEMRQHIEHDLVKRNYAIDAEESLLSKKSNHELSEKNYTKVSTGQVSTFESQEVALSWREATDVKELHRTKQQVRLQGPYNPLEVTFKGMTLGDSRKVMKVDRESVNSVTLEPDPQEGYARLLVAAGLTLQRSGHISARSTTLMGRIRGLPSIVNMLFAPHVEIRTDKDRKRYTGALCGLGCVGIENEPMYPDHDSEIAFDIKINLEDFNKINNIRMAINLLLNKEPLHRDMRIDQQKRIREGIINLLEMQRELKEPEYFQNEYQWRQIPEGLLLRIDVHNMADCPHLLPLIRPPGLITFADASWHQKIKVHLEGLDKMVKNGTNRDPCRIRCELCDSYLNSTADLKVHLNNIAHQRKKLELDKVLEETQKQMEKVELS